MLAYGKTLLLTIDPVKTVAGVVALIYAIVLLRGKLSEAKKEVDKAKKEDDKEYDSAFQRIKDCRTIEDFIREYNSLYYQQCMENLRVAVGNQDTSAWAEEWAKRIRPEPGPPKDVALNRDRKVCLLLLSSLCKRWKSQEDTQITVNDIVKVFKGFRISRITAVSLPMDRAQALYKMKYNNRAEFGMHWVAQQDVDKSPEWQNTLKKCDGFPTINRSFHWLMEVEKLQLQNQWAELLKPESPEWTKVRIGPMNESPV